MNKRDETDIWANMYDLPLIETPLMMPPVELLNLPSVKEPFGEDIKVAEVSEVKKHILTHQRLYVRLIKLESKPVKLNDTWFFTPIENLRKLALPKIIFIFIEKFINL